MLRTIVEEAEPSRLKDEVTTKHPRTDHAWMALHWLLAHNPDIGTDINIGPNVRLHKQKAITVDVPEITVLYTFDDSQVVIKFARFDFLLEIEDDEEDDGSEAEQSPAVSA